MYYCLYLIIKLNFIFIDLKHRKLCPSAFVRGLLFIQNMCTYVERGFITKNPGGN